MIKRFLAAALTLALLFLCAVPVFAESEDGPVSNSRMHVVSMYVYTDNGKGLNVRSAPIVANNIIGLAPFGTELEVQGFLDGGWACVYWMGQIAYVQSRYLQETQPVTPTPQPYVYPTAVPYVYPTAAPYVYPTATPYTYPTTAPYSYTDTLATLNAEFRTARMVTPFVIVVRPTRASGWVNMRWAPSKDTEVLGTYRSGARLTVLAETQSWYQVVDPDTEVTGFIMKTYTTRQN